MTPRSRCTEVPAPKRRQVFGRNVRSLRLAKGLSQEKFAEVSDLHRTYIGSVESGKRNVALDTMERIASALEVDVADLLQDAERESDDRRIREHNPGAPAYQFLCSECRAA